MRQDKRSSGDRPVRATTTCAFGDCAPSPVSSAVSDALAALGAAIDHNAESVRKYAAELLGQMSHDARTGGAHEAEALLRTRLDRERSADVRHAIMRALRARHVGASSP